jgi:hypothetical protein
MAYAAEQAQRCYRRLGFPEVRSAISVLRRTRIDCEDIKGSAAVATLDPDHLLGTRATVMSGWSFTMDHLNVESAASHLIHEAMHWGANNNRRWHNDAERHLGAECSHSLFLDKVYLIQAACFPDSERGRDFYVGKNGLDCPGNCEAALTETDPDTISWWPRFLHPEYENILSKPMKREQAASVCKRIRDDRRRYLELMRDQFEIRDRIGEAGVYLRGHLDPPDAEMINRLLDDFRDSAVAAFVGGANLPRIRNDLERRDREFASLFAARCTAPSGAWVGFCAIRENPVRATIRDARAKVAGIGEDELLLYVPAPLVPH